MYETDPAKARLYFETHDLKGLANQFKTGYILFTFEQSLFYLQCTNSLSKLIVDCPQELTERIFKRASSQSDRFSSYKEFEDYYLAYATKTLHDIKQEYSFNPYILEVFNSLFERH